MNDKALLIMIYKTFRSLVIALFLALFTFGCTNKEDEIIEEEDLWEIKVGREFAGGIVLQVDESGTRGIVVAKSDQARGNLSWGCSDKFLNNSSTVGSGATNTKNILNNCNEQSIAARFCDQLNIPSEVDNMLGNYSNWFLPSLDEMKLLYQRKELIGGFENHPYWTSTDLADDGAFVLSFLNGQVLEGGKDFKSPYLRCMRTFHNIDIW